MRWLGGVLHGGRKLMRGRKGYFVSHVSPFWPFSGRVFVWCVGWWVFCCCVCFSFRETQFAELKVKIAR